MIEVLMKNHLVSDTNCNVVNPCYPIFFDKEQQNNVRFTFSVGDTTHAVHN